MKDDCFSSSFSYQYVSRCCNYSNILRKKEIFYDTYKYAYTLLKEEINFSIITWLLHGFEFFIYSETRTSRSIK